MLRKHKFQSLLSKFWSAVKGDERDYTSGSIKTAIIMLSIPMILEMIMESTFAIVDIYFVGKVSVNAVATVTLTESVIMIIFAIAIGMSMAATAMISRRVGEKKPEEASAAAGQFITLAFVTATIFSVIGIFFAPEILTLMGGEPDVVRDGSNYTRIMLAGNYSIMYLFIINAIFRGAGNAAIAMRSLTLANVLNIILDPLFIFGVGSWDGMGVEGAAVATTIGRSIGVIYQFSALAKNRSSLRIKLDYLKPKLESIKRILKLSLGGIGQFLIGTLSWVFMVRISAEFGTEVLAGYAIAFRVIMFTILPAWGMSNAAATLVGQNLGAKEPDRAEKTVWITAWYNAAFLTLISIIFVLFSTNIVALFNTNPEVIRVGAVALKYIGFGYVFYAFAMVITQAFNGAGDTKTPTWINFISMWLVEVPLAWVLAITLDLGPEGLFAAIAISAGLMAFISIVLFRRGKWKLTEV